jgi:hypothetical protein
MQVAEMKLSGIHNVCKWVRHNLASARAASRIIVRNRGTHLHDCGFRELSVEELNSLKSNLCIWVKQEA